MPGYFKLVNAIYLMSLAAWLAALASAGIAAGNVFGVLDDMSLELERYATYPSQEHGMLAAGHVMEGVFVTVDLIQIVAIPLTLLALGMQLAVYRLPLRSPANAVRTLCLVAATGLFAYHATALAPRMNRELRARWSAAEAGDVAAARAHQMAFNQDHPTADLILKTNLILLIIALGASAAALSPSPPSASPRLPEPKLGGQ